MRYDVDTFNCVDFTSEAGHWFSKIGITAHQVVGKEKDSTARHSWVGIDVFGYIWHFEPQRFVFFNPEEDYTEITLNNRTIT